MRRRHLSCKVTRCTKLRGAQRSPELALKSTDFHAPGNLIFPVLIGTFMCFSSYIMKLILKEQQLHLHPGKGSQFLLGKRAFFAFW